jgi:hypothetical protein
MSVAIPPLPQYAFMAWCSVKESTGTTFTSYAHENISKTENQLVLLEYFVFFSSQMSQVSI